MSVTMIPIGELLEDKVFHRFFTQTPAMYPHQAAKPDGWRLWVKPSTNSPWRRKNVQHYQSGVQHILRGLAEGLLHDAVLQCRGVSYRPPVKRLLVKDPRTKQPVLVTNPKTGAVTKKIVEKTWQPDPALIQEYGRHEWCFYCRRPTVFAYFLTHPAFLGTPLAPFYDSTVRRCAICGISYDNYRRY
jgi:hypothetical protein